MHACNAQRESCRPCRTSSVRLHSSHPTSCGVFRRGCAAVLEPPPRRHWGAPRRATPRHRCAAPAPFSVHSQRMLRRVRSIGRSGENGDGGRINLPICCNRQYLAKSLEVAHLDPIISNSWHPLIPGPAQDTSSTHCGCPVLKGSKWTATMCESGHDLADPCGPLRTPLWTPPLPHRSSAAVCDPLALLQQQRRPYVEGTTNAALPPPRPPSSRLLRCSETRPLVTMQTIHRSLGGCTRAGSQLSRGRRSCGEREQPMRRRRPAEEEEEQGQRKKKPGGDDD